MNLKTIQIPASKSIMQRAVAAALLAKGTTIIRNPVYCDDTAAALQMAQALGAEIKENQDFISIEGGLKKPPLTINAGESGLALRMFLPIVALTGSGTTITGNGSLLHRPIGMVADAMQQGGVECFTTFDLLPIHISGKLQSGTFFIDGAITSQLLTGLLMALPVLEGDSIVFVDNLKSKPYIDLTLAVLKDFGISVQHIDYKRFFIRGNQEYKTCNYMVEGDWSSAAFWLVYGAIVKNISVSGLNPESKQADMAILDALKSANCRVLYEKGAFISEKSDVAAFTFDATECPDLIPILTLLAACAKGTSKIGGVQRLQFKESNRSKVLTEEFTKLGVNIQQDGDIFEIVGGEISGGLVDSHNDHRIAMTLAIASMVSKEKIIIQNPDCVHKSYPNFFRDIDKIKFH